MPPSRLDYFKGKFFYIQGICKLALSTFEIKANN